MPKPLKPEEVWQRLRRHDKRFVLLAPKRGKGSHRMISHPDVGGRPASIPIPCHKGRDVKQGILESVIRRFGLPRNFFD